MLFSQLSVLAFLLEFLSAFHLSNHVILDTVFLGFSIACFTARQPKHICKKCFHLITDPSREKPMAFRLSGDIWSDHWATHHATLTAICLCQHHEVRAGAEVTSHCLRPTSARFQLEQDDQVGPGDLELARYSFKSKGYTAKHRIVQENDDQALEGQVVGRACCGGIYIY